MLNGLMLADHTVSLEHVSLEPKTCENCRKPFLRKSSSIQVFCNPCRSMYQETGSQLQGCAACGTERKFGDLTPDDKRPRRLYCRHCVAVTEHIFSRVVGWRDWATK
jgi:hypothetical protein